MSNHKHLEKNPADEDLPVDVSNDIERTPTEKSGDETQRNEQSSTKDGLEDRKHKRGDRLERPEDEVSSSSRL
jgi:hypothetical protein